MNPSPHRTWSCLIVFLSSLCSLCLCGESFAADEKEPYRIRLVLSIAQHPLLTKTKLFRDQVARELSDGLQAALGSMAKVEVAKTHPKLEDVRLHGLVKGLEGWRERSEYKTYFVQIDYSGTSYTIQTRQHDGLLGLTSPVVRRDRTRDRAYVGRTAALLIEQDLGLLGTVESEPDGKRLVRVALKAGKLGDPGKWVKKDEVFALVRVSGGSAGEPVPWAVLQVEEPPSEGVCVCRFFSRYRLPRVAGLRCVLLGTHKGTLRLRLVQERPGKGSTQLDAPVELQIRRNGFEGEEATKLRFSSNGSRDVNTETAYSLKGVFNRVAFISLLSGGTLKARIPVPLVDEGLIVLPAPAGNDDEGNLIAFRFRALQRAVIDSYQVQTDLFKEINADTAKPERRAAALAKVRQTLERSRQDHDRLRTERLEVGKEVAKLPGAERPNMQSVDSRLNLLKLGEAELLKHVAVLEKIMKEENDPGRQETKIQIERAKLLEKEADLEQAIAIYEKIPEKYRPPELEKHLAALKKQWNTDERPALKTARNFIYKEWPTLDTPGVAKQIAQAATALGACKKADDLYGPVKLLTTTEKHVQRIEKELEALKPDVNIDDEKPVKEIKELAPKLVDLLRDIQTYLDSKKKE